MSFDSHAHLDLAAAGNSLRWKALLDRAFSAGIRGILVPAVHPDRWNNLLDLVCAGYQRGKTPRLFVALGIHPQALETLTNDEVDAAISRLEQLLRADLRPKNLVALGETGLDYRKQTGREEKEHQRFVFRHHLRLAQEHNLALTIHCVGAYGDLISELRSCPPPPSVIHGFSGKAQLAQQLCRMGHAIGIGGMITHPGAKHLKRALLAIPPDQLLLETDSPDQSPWKRRPTPNEPSFLPDIAEAAATILGEAPQSLLERASRNSHRYFGIDPLGSHLPVKE